MTNYEVTYKKGATEKKMRTREKDEESAYLQCITLWQLKDSKRLRKQITVKKIKGIM